MLRPITFGSPPSRFCQKLFVITATSAPSSSSVRKFRPQNWPDAKHIEIVRSYSAPKNLNRIADSSQCEEKSVLGGEAVKKCLSFAVMLKARRRDPKSTRLRDLSPANMCTTRDGSLNGSPRKNKSLIKLKIVVFSPIPSANVITAMIVEPWCFSEAPEGEFEVGNHRGLSEFALHQWSFGAKCNDRINPRSAARR